ncbi:MAG: Rab family GTPase [Candidatus Korarchaeota archaeon]
MTKLFKVIFAGDGAVGKTTIAQVMCGKEYSPVYEMTIGAQFVSLKVELDSDKVILTIWDLGGQPRYKEVRCAFYNKADAVVYIYDVSWRLTFENIIFWQEEAEKNCTPKVKFLVANKVDLERAVSTEEGENLAKKMGAKYIEVSAKTGQNIDILIKELVAELLK